jgi:transmembrane sensor
MMPADRRRDEEALDWVRRLDDPDFADWEGHAHWLESDPRNVAAFDAALTLIEVATAGLATAGSEPPAAMPVNDNLPVRAEYRRFGRGKWAGLGLAVAAGIVGLVSLPRLMPGAGSTYAIETLPGQQRVLALADGTRVALNGASRIGFDRRDLRTVSVERGEAFFRVAHDAAHPFAVRVGDATFQDVGTAFDVIRNVDTTEVTVREGAVMFDPQGSAVRLDPGQSIVIGSGHASIRQVDASGVGLWQRGRLSYDDASLDTVARDIARSIGEPVAIDPSVENKRFSGVIMIDQDRPRMFRHLATLTGVAIRRDGSGWRIAPPIQ